MNDRHRTMSDEQRTHRSDERLIGSNSAANQGQVMPSKSKAHSAIWEYYENGLMVVNAYLMYVFGLLSIAYFYKLQTRLRSEGGIMALLGMVFARDMISGGALWELIRISHDCSRDDIRSLARQTLSSLTSQVEM
ncbi:hypothetical protein P3S68_015615 [Capsicum galapagoense]